MRKGSTRLPVIIFFIAILLLTATWPVLAVNEEKTVSITVIHTNDIHGRITEGIGFAKISTKIEELRNSNPNILLLDAGDPFHGLPAATISKGQAMVEIMNALKYDAVALGNHDFDYGRERLLELRDMAKFPILSANTLQEDGSRLLPSYILKDFQGVRVAVFGVSSQNSAVETNPKNVKGLTFADPVEIAKEMVAELRDKADVIIMLSHLGLDESKEYTSRDVAEQVEGIDLIIDGHSHTELKEGMVVGDTLIAQTGSYLNNLGIVTVALENGTLVKKAQLFSKDDATGLVEDPYVSELINTIEKANEREASVVVGKTAVLLNGLREDVRTGETNLGNLIADAMLRYTEADAVFTNGGGITGSIEPGNITMGDLVRVIPYGNLVVTKEISGSDLLAALELGVSFYPEPSGGFPHVAGMTFVFDHQKEPGSRVVKASIGGKPLDPGKTYTIATNDFLAAGGDHYTMMAKGRETASLGSLDTIVADYIKELGTVNVTTDGRVSIAKAGTETPPVQTTGKSYTVRKGDVLWKIAERVGLTFQELAQYNQLENPDLIFPGQILLLPQ